MKKIFFFIALLTFIISCSPENSATKDSLDGSFLSSESSSSGSGSESGLITAGEWNDLENWDFWKTLQLDNEFNVHQEYWGMYPNNRISIEVVNQDKIVKGAEVELFKDGVLVASSISDNYGRVEFIVDLFENDNSSSNEFIARVEKTVLSNSLKSFEFGINEIEYGIQTSVKDKVQLSFIVDATGSMGDELNFLKEDLKDVIQRAESGINNLSFETSSVFYRDQGDSYVTKDSDFSSDINNTISFIKAQNAGGGGDFPEAVHSALANCLELDWDENAHTKIAFLLLDAPPHYNEDVIRDIKNSIQLAIEKGIKIIPISASGVSKETEFLMRYFSIATNGTYIFITNDSGIGNDHIEATVGDYEVEFLNDLMVRVIKKYIQ